MFTIKELIESPDFSYLTLLNTEGDLTREINTIETTETPDVANFLPKHTFLLTTGMAFQDNPEALCSFISSLDELPVAGLGIKLGRYIDEVPPTVIQHANNLNFPLVDIPREKTLGSVSHHLLSYLWDNQAGAMEMALNLQKQFSEMMLKDASLENLIKYLGTILKVPIILEDPFFNVIAVSQHYNSSKYSLVQFEEDNESFLKEKMRSYLKTQSKKSFENDKYFIHPIQIDSLFTYYLVLKKNSKDPFPLSSLMLEQATAVLSHTIYKNLQLIEKSVAAKQSFFDRLLVKNQINPDESFHWLKYGSDFDLIDSDYYQAGICRFVTDESSIRQQQENTQRLILVYDWFEKQVSSYGKSLILFPIESSDSFGFLVQSDDLPLKDILEDLNRQFSGSSLFTFKFYLGNPVFTIADIHYSFKEVLDTLAETQSSSSNKLIQYYETKEIADLLHYIPEHVKRHFCLSTLKDMAYPEDDSLKELRHTLKVYLDSQSEIKLSSERLFVHRNTIKYRIAKCKELLDSSLNNPQEILNLRVALEMTENQPN
ncbi:MAG: PucR family transcriptional regulator [Alkalibacterium sp.]|nr:PucR family transcriptional regulator [Alkalibacterium sp.]